MNKSLFWISNRLKLSGGSEGNRSTGSFIAVVGVALAVMVMELTLCIVAGFKSEIQHKIEGFNPQIALSPAYDYSSGSQEDVLTVDDAILNVLKESPAYRTPSLALSLPAMLKTEDDFAGVLFFAHDQNHDRTFEKSNIVEGEFPDFERDSDSNLSVISNGIAKQLQLSVGDDCFVYFFVNDVLKSRKIKIAGIYESNLTEYDKMVVYASMSMLQDVLDVSKNVGTQLEFNGLDIDNIEDVAQDFQDRLYQSVQDGRLDKLYPVSTVFQSGAIYFNWLSLLDTNVIVIFILMLAVALFTLVSSLFMIILDRIPTVGLLKSLGANNRFVSGIFLNLGFRLAVRGLIIGNIIGLGLCAVQLFTGVVKLDPQMYYLTEVPIKMQFVPLMLLNIAVLVIAVLILFLPSRAASKVDPTRTMSYD